MNANELADDLENYYVVSGDKLLSNSATMLRQQQAEIKALKKKVVSLEFLARKEK